MSPHRIELITRYGAGGANPTAAQLVQAVRELFEEDRPGMTEGDDDEHGAAYLAYEADDGAVYYLSMTRSGFAHFESFADPDCHDPLDPPAEMADVSPGLMLELWGHLARGDIDSVRRHPWHPAP